MRSKVENKKKKTVFERKKKRKKERIAVFLSFFLSFFQILFVVLKWKKEKIKLRTK